MTAVDELDEGAVNAAAAWGRRYTEAAAAPQVVDLDDPGASVHVVRRMDDETVETHDHEGFLPTPRRPAGGVLLTQPESFALYVTGQHVTTATPTRLFADLDARTVTAVFNDHQDATLPGWRDHTATYQAQVDRDWTDWLGRDGKLSDQTSFGEFVEEHLHSIVKPEGKPSYPSAAEMLEVALTLTAKRNVEFDAATRLQSGDVEFAWRETTSAQAGRVTKAEVPERFAIRVPPFVGHPPVVVEARLRYRADQSGFRIGYKLLRPDLAEQHAFQEITTTITTGTPEDVPLLWGSSPKPSQRTSR